MAQRVKPPAVKPEQTVSLETSLKTVNVLLETAVGCITYLRNLFPDDAFEDHNIRAPRPPPSSHAPPSSSQGNEKETTAKVKRLVRGHSEAADTILNWIEVGAADAIQKSYLQHLVFAIYLDPNNPSNVVECYTFTITYDTDSLGHKHPELVVRNQLSGMVISGKGSDEPRGRKLSVKEGDAKRQVQHMIKNLIMSTGSLDELPRRRFISIRLYYTEDTPPDYEPPHFRPFEGDSPRFQITTSNVHELPEVHPLGSISTGFHGVALHVVHIAPLLEVVEDPTITPEESTARNRTDALSRPVVWDPQELILLGNITEASETFASPIGVQDDSGVLWSMQEIKQGVRGEELRDAVGLGGKGEEEKIVAREGAERVDGRKTSDNEALLTKDLPVDSSDEQANLSQQPSTQTSPIVSRKHSSRPSVPFFDETPEEYSQRATAASQGSSKIGRTPPVALAPVPEDSEMDEDEEQEEEEDDAYARHVKNQAQAQGFPSSVTSVDMHSGEETQPFFQDSEIIPDGTSSASSFSAPGPSSAVGQWKNVPSSSGTARGTWARSSTKDFSRCDCGDKDDDEAMVGCSACNSWKHAVCYGYLGANDPRLPEDFYCWPCRVILGISDALLNPEREAEVLRALDDLGSLALFRRAITTVWDDGVLNTVELSQRLAVDLQTTAQIIRRLKRENFLQDEATLPVKSKNRRQQPSGGGRAFHKEHLVVNKSPAQARLKKDTYFDPGRGAELASSMLLDCTDLDAEGSEEALSRRSSINTNTNEGTIAAPAPSYSHSLRMNPTATTRAIASSTSAANGEDDPIETSDDEDGGEGGLRHKAPWAKFSRKEEKLEMVQLPQWKGKGRAGVAPAGGDFHRASSNLHPPPESSAGSTDLSQVDDDVDDSAQPEPETLVGTYWDPPQSTSSAKGASPPLPVEAAGGTTPRKTKKRAKCSAAPEPVEV